MRRSLRLLPVLVAALLVLAVAQPANATISRTLSLKASTSSALTSATVTFSGVLSKSSTGSPVKLQHKVGTRWVTAKTTATTTSTGAYKTTLTMPKYTAGTNYYRTVATATSTRGIAISRTVAIAVLWKVTATLVATPYYVSEAGDSITVHGSVAPFVAGAGVDIQRQSPTGSWSTVKTTTLSGSGSYSTSVSVPADGAFRVHVPRTGNNAAAYSAADGVFVGPSIATAALPDAVIGVPYAFYLKTLEPDNGTFSATGLPDHGLSLNPSTGLISGTPSATGTLALTIGFTGMDNRIATPKHLDLTINPPPPPVILTSHLPDGAQLTAYSAQLYVSGNVPGTWSASGLPSGFSVDPSTGVISAQALQNLSSGDFTVTLNFTQTSTSQAASAKQVSLHIGSLGSATTPTTASAGGQFSCRVDASKKLWCWGYDESGELGDGGALASDPPGVVTPTQVGSATDWTGVSTGAGLVTERHACGTRGTDGYCWGSDKFGELGHAASAGSATSPVSIDGGHAWSQLSAGSESTCGVTTGGELWCWGNNDFGQLGFSTGGLDQGTPARVGFDSDWSQVSIGYTSACAVKGTGALYCWGMNARGQLGTGDTSSNPLPVQVGTGTTWAQVSVGNGYACAVKTGGTAYCWGPSSNGQLGNGKFTNSTTSDELSPKQIGGIDWTSIAAGAGTTCGVKSGGQLWCWGYNVNGQVGDGSNSSRGFPVRIGTALDWSTVSVGDGHACGVKAGNEVWCWGSNFKGQLGSSTAPSSTSNVPVKVTG